LIEQLVLTAFLFLPLMIRDPPRERILFNDAWRFFRGDPAT
jgi:hypothetical protein